MTEETTLAPSIPKLTPEWEISLLVEGQHFTENDLRLVRIAMDRAKIDYETVRYSFAMRTDLSGTPWQLYAKGNEAK